MFQLRIRPAYISKLPACDGDLDTQIAQLRQHMYCNNFYPLISHLHGHSAYDGRDNLRRAGPPPKMPLRKNSVLNSMNQPRILTPEQLRNAPLLGGPPMPPRPPSLDEVLPQYVEGMKAAAARDLSALPALVAYGALSDCLLAGGLQKPLISKLLPRVKIAVTEAFINHSRYAEVIQGFANIMVQLHRAVTARFGDEGEALFLTMCEDRFALVLPV